MAARPAARQRLANETPGAHFLAGAAGGLASTLLTSPLDVLKTQLQSSMGQQHLRPQHMVTGSQNSMWSRHFQQTAGVMHNIYHTQGWRGFFRGLGPSLSGVVPSMALKFYVYGNCKRIGAHMLNVAEDSAVVHAQAAVIASMTVSTVMNPVFVVKTRLQLDIGSTGSRNMASRYASSLHCVRAILGQEGFRGLYRGLAASYLGTVETAFQLVLYEQLKEVLRPSAAGSNEGGDATWSHTIRSWMGASGAAGSAKLAAVLVTYPHEVLRTRLRQAPVENGARKYVGLVQCFRLVRAEEGLAGLYGGMTAHLMRSIPSTVIIFGVYECVLNLL